MPGEFDTFRNLIYTKHTMSERKWCLVNESWLKDNFFYTWLHMESMTCQIINLNFTYIFVFSGNHTYICKHVLTRWTRKFRWETALYYAVQERNIQMIRLLIACNADMNEYSGDLFTPLHLADFSYYDLSTYDNTIMYHRPDNAFCICKLA